MATNNNGGMPDISSMRMGAGYAGGSQPPQKQSGKRSMPGEIRLSGNTRLAVIGAAVVILVLAGFLAAGKITESKVKDAYKAYVKSSTGQEINWKKYYPEELAEGMKERFEAVPDDMFDEDLPKIKILSVTKLSSAADGMLEDMVLDLWRMVRADVPAKGLKISGGYVLLLETDGKVGWAVVAKVNGKYGLYASEPLY